jgi:hypothetical protein
MSYTRVSYHPWRSVRLRPRKNVEPSACPVHQDAHDLKMDDVERPESVAENGQRLLH